MFPEIISNGRPMVITVMNQGHGLYNLIDEKKVVPVAFFNYKVISSKQLSQRAGK